MSAWLRLCCALKSCRRCETRSDETGFWGECLDCGKRYGFVSRQAMDRYIGAAMVELGVARADLLSSEVQSQKSGSAGGNLPPDEPPTSAASGQLDTPSPPNSAATRLDGGNPEGAKS